MSVRCQTDILIPSSLLVSTAFAATGVTILGIGEKAVTDILFGREKLVNRELKVRENLTGILLAANTAVRAVAARQTDIIRRHEQLDIAFQTDNRELAESDKQLVAIVAQYQIIAAKP